MKVFLSHARKDEGSARTLRQCLEREGFSVWTPEDHILPGENWAKKMAKGLDQAELMVFLLTPRAFESDSLRRDFEFALGSQKYEGRVFSVLVGPTMQAGKDVPWILLRLPHIQVESIGEFPQAAKEINK